MHKNNNNNTYQITLQI